VKANWLRTMGLTGLGLLASASLGRAGGPGDVPGPIDSLSDLQETGRMLFKMADENNDGQISQKEAIDAGNLLVGGFFFRADANGDGILTRDEVRQARDSFLSQHPLMRILVQKNQGVVAASPGSPAANAEQMFETLVDTNRDGNLQASEVRQIVQTSVAALFASADTNRDGLLSPTEVNAALIGMANAAATAAFNAADVDHNGQISQAEFDKAIIEPANAIFRAMDANNDGQISPQEAQTARQTIVNEVKKLRVPEPANSARNLINTGANPSQVAPVPNFGQPTTTAPQPR
jgi:Ca2+-binding EF-hand superfamily protein